MISVIMASYLGHYPGAASNREDKFRRAINSFLAQGIGELVIVADGCDKTVEIVQSEYSQHENIRVFKLEKQALFSGKIRNFGIEQAKYDWICYLDSDDEFGSNHLTTILDNAAPGVWLYWNDCVNDTERNVNVAMCSIGTSAIAHEKTTSAKWPDGYGHDWRFITQLGPTYKKILGTKYIVRHIPGKVDS